METDIFKTLRELNRIHPDSAYATHSRMLILASPQQASVTAPRIGTFLRLSAILGAGLVGILAVLGGTTYINETYSPLALEGLNQKSLTAEANGINNSIEITLGTIDYLDTSNQITLKKITEVGKTHASTTAVTASPAAASTTSTAMDAFLIKSDSTGTPTGHPINDVLEQLSK